MPEIKRNFTKGRMNKDLDERLVPLGEYRHAENIQVSTSEESNVGSIQNILGNAPGCNYTTSGWTSPIPAGSLTIGSIADEKNDTLYWLISGYNSEVPPNWNSETTLKDMIMRTADNSAGCEPVFVDTYAFATTNVDSLGNYLITTDVDSINLTGGQVTQIETGWTVHGITSNGTTSNTATVTHLDYGDPYGFDWEYLPTTSAQLQPTFCLAGTNPPCRCNSIAMPGLPDMFMNYTYMPQPDVYLMGCIDNQQTMDLLYNPSSGLQTTITTNMYGNGQHTADITNAQIVTITNVSTGTSDNVVKLTLDINIPNNFNPALNFPANAIYNGGAFGLDSSETPGSVMWAESNSIVLAGTTNSATGWMNINLPGTSGGYDVSDFSVGDYIEVGLGVVSPGSLLGTITYCVCDIEITAINANEDNSIMIANPNPSGVGCAANCGFTPIPGLGIPGMQPMLAGVFTTGSSIFANLDSTLLLSQNNYSRLIWEGPRVLNFDHKNIISSINIVDDMLYWTDGYYDAENNLIGSEPKKINIPRSVDGTNWDGLEHTDFLNNKTNTSTPAKEEHITVIKRPPLSSPNLIMFGEREGNSNGLLDQHEFGAGDGTGDQVELIITGTDLNYQIGDILYIQMDNGNGIEYPITNPDVRVVIDDIPAANTYLCTILSISDSVPPGLQNYGVDLDKSYDKLYKLKFPRFALRYKYQDGEYSTYGPFSEVAFLPGDYNYMPNVGYNLGMQNTLRELTLEGIIPGNIPDGVVQVDILYKESDSPNVYVEIIPSDPYWTNNSYTIKEETIKTVLPSNQLLRPWDNVPRKALAQEVTGNRIVYGNYLQNYNLDLLRPNFNTFLKPRLESANIKSIKSIRDYQLGVVYCDKYNRQTPVLSDASAAIPVPKHNSSIANQIEIKPLSDPPAWATHQKFYIKDSHSEYYNLSLDRYYDAKDDNIWLAFPSNDRNKIDLDTSLHLKKRYKSDEAELDTSVYKVIDVKNEAPEYIKTRRSILGRVGQDMVSPAVFDTTDEVPRHDVDEFSINIDGLENTILENFHKRHNSPDMGSTITTPSGGNLNNGPLFIRLVDVNADNVLQGQVTNWYEVDNIKKDADGSQTYLVRLRKPLEQSDAGWVYDTTTALTAASLGDPDYLYGGAQNVVTGKQLALEVGQDIVQNKALFQGRFFAKILKDQSIEESIINQGSFANTTVVASADLSYLKDFDHEDPGMNNVWGGSFNMGYHYSTIQGFNSSGFSWTSGSTGSQPGYPNYSPNHVPDGKPVPDRAYWSFYIWQQIQRQLDTAGSRWVIDEAFAVGEEPWVGKYGYNWNDEHFHLNSSPSSEGWNVNMQQSQLPANSYYNAVSSIYGGYNERSSNASTIKHNQATTMGFYSYPHIAGLSHGNDTTQYEYFSEGHGVQAGKDYIDISYIGPGREQFHNNPSNISYMDDYGSTWSGAPSLSDWMDISNQTTWWRDYWKIHGSNGNSNNNSDIGDGLDEQAQKFANALTEGAYIRFKDDTTGANSQPRIYEVTNVKKIYKFNYSEALNNIDYPFCRHWMIYMMQYPAFGSPWVNQYRPYGDNWKKFFHKAYFNRRITFRIYLKDIVNGLSPGDNIILGYNPLNDGTDDLKIGGYATSGNMCGIEILNRNYVTDNDIPFPTNPAVFETEPKSSEGLDIFHEISDTIPINLRGYGYEFAPAGTIVTSNSNGYIGGNGQARVVAWNDNVVTLDEVAIQDFASQNPPTFLYFTRPDGTYTTARVFSLAAPIIPGPWDTSYSVELVSNVQNNKIGLGWHNCYAFGNGVESNRVRDTFNSVFIDKGPKVSTTFSEGYKEEHRKYGLIYSGLYNSTSGINNLNQFIQAEKITKDINPTYGSIQRLHTRDSDLITLCEDKILKILANKDAVFNADGNANLTATNNVLGQTVPFVGEYGISKNPESFASESYRAYFTDKVRGVVLRLSRDGLTPISDAGMKDWFRDNLKLSNKLIGSYDDKKAEYNITLGSNHTVTYREDVKGWVSFKSFLPENGLSCANEYYTFQQGSLWKHHDESVDRNTFYNGTVARSRVDVIINDMPGSIKTFHTLSYEGSQSRILQSISYDTWDVTSWDGSFDTNGVPNYLTSINTVSDQDYYNLTNAYQDAGWFVKNIETDKELGSVNEFIEKEGKWFNYIKGKPWQ